MRIGMRCCRKGAFCAACSKVVIDFTALSDEEVKNYFLKNKEQRTCGRFKNHQLSTPEQLLGNLLMNSIPFWKKFLAIVVILFGNFLTGCNQATQGKVDVPEKVEVRPKIESTTGVILLEPKNELQIGTPAIVNEISCTTEVGMIEYVTTPDSIALEDFTKGDIVEMPFEKALPVAPAIQGKDSAKKAEIKKNSCDSLESDKTVYYEP